MLIFYSWMPADDTGNARQCVQCDQGFFLIFFWIEFVPVILYLEFCMDVDRPCLYLPSIYTLQVFKNFWKDCTLDLVLTCIIFTRFVVPYTTEDIVTTVSMSELNWPQWHVNAPMDCWYYDKQWHVAPRCARWICMNHRKSGIQLGWRLCHIRLPVATKVRWWFLSCPSIYDEFG